MNKEKNVILAFMHLLQKQPQLFSEEQRAQLEELLKKQGNLTGLSNVIEMWCRLHPHHIDWQLANLLDIGLVGLIPSSASMGFPFSFARVGAVFGAAGGGGNEAPSPEELEKLREELINIIRIPRK